MTDNKKTDSRIIRSKRDLAVALEELLEEKNFDDISITEITSKAMVSKNTFYNNFEDKNELLQFLFRRYADQVHEEIEKVLLKESSIEDTLYEIDKIIVHFFYNSRLSFEKIVKNDKSKNLYWAMNSFVKNLITETIERYPSYFSKSIPVNFVGYIYSGAISNTIYFMFNDETKIDEDKCVDYIYEIITPKLLES